MQNLIKVLVLLSLSTCCLTLNAQQTCSNAFVIPGLPFSINGLNTGGSVDDYDLASICDASEGEDYVFAFTPQVEYYTFNVTVTFVDPFGFVGVSLVANCPDDPNAVCLDAQDDTNDSQTTLEVGGSLSAGVNYYIVVEADSPTQFSISGSGEEVAQVRVEGPHGVIGMFDGNTRKVGIENPAPAQTFSVGGKVEIADDSNPPTPGSVRYNAFKNDFEGFNGAEWLSLTGGKGQWGAVQNYAHENDGALSPFNANADDNFGWAVALHSDRALIGGPTIQDTGRVAAYKLNNDQWDLMASPTPGPGAEAFGFSVAMDGSQAIVGAPESDVNGNGAQGRAYIYEYDGSTWNMTASLFLGSGSIGDQFGYSVDIDGDYAIVGAPFVLSNQGRAYIWRKIGSVWTLAATLNASDGSFEDLFGFKVDIDGQQALIGAPDAQASALPWRGQAYVFERNGSNWFEAQILKAPGNVIYEGFGADVAIHDSLIVIGAPGKTVDNKGNAGMVHVFEKQASQWQEIATVAAPDVQEYGRFGSSVALDYPNIVCGAPFAQIGIAKVRGIADVYKYDGIQVVHQTSLAASDGDHSARFGESVAVHGNWIVVGAAHADVGLEDEAGKVYFYGK